MISAALLISVAVSIGSALMVVRSRIASIRAKEWHRRWKSKDPEK